MPHPVADLVIVILRIDEPDPVHIKFDHPGIQKYPKTGDENFYAAGLTRDFVNNLISPENEQCSEQADATPYSKEDNSLPDCSQLSKPVPQREKPATRKKTGQTQEWTICAGRYRKCVCCHKHAPNVTTPSATTIPHYTTKFGAFQNTEGYLENGGIK